MNTAFFRGKRVWQLGIAAWFACWTAQAAHADEAREERDPPAAPVRLDDIKGQYALPGGRLLTMTGSEYRIHAQLDGHEDTIVTRVGPAAFRATDGSFTLRFRPHANGNVVTVDLTEAPGQAPARGTAPRSVP